jgi:hypothetical protein
VTRYGLTENGADNGVLLDNIARATGLIGAAFTAYNDYRSGRVPAAPSEIYSGAPRLLAAAKSAQRFASAKEHIESRRGAYLSKHGVRYRSLTRTF